MKTYWDLTEKERAELTEEQVQAFEAVELMTRGIVRPVEPPMLEDAPGPALEKVMVYRVKHHGYATLDVALPTLDAARAFVASNPWVLETQWLGGRNCTTVRRLSECEPSIDSEELPTHSSVSNHEQSLRRANEINAANAKLRTEHREAAASVEKALSGMWNDWRACAAKAVRMQHIADTFAEYRQMAGDADVARAFLLRAFGAETLAEAEAWTGESYVPPAGVVAPPAREGATA